MKVRNTEGYIDLVPYKAILNVNREKKAESKSAFRPLVYICSPFSGDIEGNKQKAAEFAHFAYKQGCIPLTPHLLFPFMNDESREERAVALRMDIILMGKCQEVWVLSENGISSGMAEEIDKATRRHQTIRYFNNAFVEVER